MPAKTIGATPLIGSNAGTDLLQTVTGYGTAEGFKTDFSNELRTKVWSELVTRDAREKNVFKKFIGSEGSGKPIVEKRDLSAGGSDHVVFTTVAPIRGQGVRGEAILKNNTGKLKFGTFNVEVDLIRHAVAWTQVLKLMRFTGKTLDQLSAEVMSEWAARTEQDHIMYVARNTCESVRGDNLLDGYGSGAGGLLKYVDGLSTDIIQEAKQALIANGAEPMNTGGDQNQEIPGYLFFAPDAVLRPLRSDPDYLEAILQADSRGGDNKLYSGSYAKWDNNIIANHNVIIDTAEGRQGSPLAPIYVDRGTGTRTGLHDTGDTIGSADHDGFANFPGATVAIPGGGGKLMVEDTASTKNVAANNYVLLVDSNKKYRVYKVDEYTSLGQLKLGDEEDFDLIDTVNVFKGQDFTGNVSVYPCNSIGTPLGLALAFGKGAFYLARGAVSNEQIFHYDDFANSGNQAHLSAVGVQSVYGLAAYEDTDDRIPGVCMVECVRQIPGLSIVQA